MLQKMLKGRTLALVAVLLLLSATMAMAVTQYYTYEGQLVEVQDRACTVINNDEKVVIHAIVPASVNLSPTFRPGMNVKVYLLKTNFGAWELRRIEKLSD